MFPEQTVQAFIDLKGKVLQPIHWGTFNLALHAWYEPMERLISEAWNKGVPLSTPVIGDVVDYHNLGIPDLWWLPSMEESLGQEGKMQLSADFSVAHQQQQHTVLARP